MECDRTLDQPLSPADGGIQKMRVELEIDVRIQPRHQALQAFAPDQFVCGADVGERSTPQMLEFKQLSDEEVSVIHEGGDLRRVFAQLLDDASTVYDIGMIDESDQFVEIGGTK